MLPSNPLYQIFEKTTIERGVKMHPSFTMFFDLCKERNVRPTKVMTDLKFGTGTVTNWRQGKSYPKPDKVRAIAEYFNVDWTDFYV